MIFVNPTLITYWMNSESSSEALQPTIALGLSSAVRSISTMKTQALLCPPRPRLSQYTDRTIMSFVGSRTEDSGTAICVSLEGAAVAGIKVDLAF